MNLCLNCGSATQNPKFCSLSCSAKSNNKGVRRHGKPRSRCKHCGNRTKGALTSYCSNACQIIYQEQALVERWLLTNNFTRRQVPTYVKKYLLHSQDYLCAICHCETSWNDKPLVFICDHIDGNSQNNSRVNLRMVCPNCDSQLPTYKGRNRGRGRGYRRDSAS